MMEEGVGAPDNDLYILVSTATHIHEEDVQDSLRELRL